MGLVTQSQVNQGLEQLRLKELQGGRVTLGEVLIEMGVLSAEQVREVIEHQDKELLTCSNASCATRYNIRNFDQNKRYACKKCGCPLGIVPMRKPPHFDAEAGDSAAMPSLTGKDVQRAMAQASRKFVVSHPSTPLRVDSGRSRSGVDEFVASHEAKPSGVSEFTPIEAGSPPACGGTKRGLHVPPTTDQKSNVNAQMSNVKCEMSNVKCQMLPRTCPPASGTAVLSPSCPPSARTSASPAT